MVADWFGVAYPAAVACISATFSYTGWVFLELSRTSVPSERSVGTKVDGKALDLEVLEMMSWPSVRTHVVMSSCTP
jgi:hypothetical protein